MEIFGCKVFIKISNPKCGIKNAKIAQINFIKESYAICYDFVAI